MTKNNFKIIKMYSFNGNFFYSEMKKVQKKNPPPDNIVLNVHTEKEKKNKENNLIEFIFNMKNEITSKTTIYLYSHFDFCFLLSSVYIYFVIRETFVVFLKRIYRYAGAVVVVVVAKVVDNVIQNGCLRIAL